MHAFVAVFTRRRHEPACRSKIAKSAGNCRYRYAAYTQQLNVTEALSPNSNHYPILPKSRDLCPIPIFAVSETIVVFCQTAVMTGADCGHLSAVADLGCLTAIAADPGALP